MKLALDDARVSPGDRVRGRLTVAKGGLQEIAVGLLFRERAKGAEVTISQVLAREFAGDVPEGATLEFEVEVPSDALPSVATRHGGLFWEVVARTDRVGARTASIRVEVVPRP